jgi:hypothetical protein
MKVLEYLAAGLPVVSTPVALPADVAPLVTVVEPPAFAAAAVAAVGERGKADDPALTGRDWSRVAATLLDHHLARTGDPRGAAERPIRGDTPPARSGLRPGAR